VIKKQLFIDHRFYTPFVVLFAFAELMTNIISISVPPESDLLDKSDREDEIQKQKNIVFAVEFTLLLLILIECLMSYYVLKQMSNSEHQEGPPADVEELKKTAHMSGKTPVIQGHTLESKQNMDKLSS
jgi:hypothetical protein